MPCNAYYKYDILTLVEVRGSDSNVRKGIYSLCGSLCTNALRRMSKQTMLSQRLCWQYRNVTDSQVRVQDKSHYGGLPLPRMALK